jgi:hypothetical protein
MEGKNKKGTEEQLWSVYVDDNLITLYNVLPSPIFTSLLDYVLLAPSLLASRLSSSTSL